MDDPTTTETVALVLPHGLDARLGYIHRETVKYGKEKKLDLSPLVLVLFFFFSP